MAKKQSKVKSKIVPSKAIRNTAKSFANYNKESEECNSHWWFSQSLLKNLLTGCLLMCIGAFGTVVYLKYYMQDTNLLGAKSSYIEKGSDTNSSSKIIDNQEQSTVSSNDLNLLHSATDKYHLALFSFKILQDLKANRDYSSDIDNLIKYSENFKNEIDVLKTSKELALTPNAVLFTMIDSLHSLTKVKPITAEKGWWGTLISTLENMITVRDTQDTQANNILLLNALKERISLGEFTSAVNIINAFSEKDNLRKVEEVLNARIEAQNAANAIFNYAMKNV